MAGYWPRKHVAELQRAVRRYLGNHGAAARPGFEGVIELARRVSDCPLSGRDTKLVKLVSKLCAACLDAGCFECSGRRDWQQPCRFVGDSSS